MAEQIYPNKLNSASMTGYDDANNTWRGVRVDDAGRIIARNFESLVIPQSVTISPNSTVTVVDGAGLFLGAVMASGVDPLTIKDDTTERWLLLPGIQTLFAFPFMNSLKISRGSGVGDVTVFVRTLAS